MPTKDQQIVDAHSDWNQAPGAEPVFVLRANNWRAVLVMATLAKTGHAVDLILSHAREMKAYSDGDDIPF